MSEVNGHSIDYKSGWETKKLKDICEITSSKRIFQNEYVSTGIPFYRTKEIKELSEGKEVSVELFISNNKYDELKSRFDLPKKGEILVSAVGTIGVSYIIKDDQPFYFKDGNLVWLKNLNGVDSRYLNYYIKHFIKFKNSIATSGSAYNALTIIKLKEFEILLPPLQEQHSIVTKIEELFSELDKSIETLKTAQQQLKVYRQSVLKWAFEGRLTNEEVKEGELPDGWEWTKLNEIGKWTGGGTPSKQNKLYWGNGDVLWVSPKDMKTRVVHDTEDKITSESISQSSAKWIKKGSILFVVRSGIIRRLLPISIAGKDLTTNQDLQSLTLSENMLTEYVYWYCISKESKIREECAKDGTTVDNLEVPKLKIYPIIICPEREQRKVVEEIERRMSVADKVEETIVNSLEQAEALRQSILEEAFAGRLIKD